MTPTFLPNSSAHPFQASYGEVSVESASIPGQEYKVLWNSQYRVLQCSAHNGQPCPASASGKQCYHKRIALAILELERVETLLQRQAEQAEIEAQEYYRFEMAMHELEMALDKLDAIALEADERDALRACGVIV